MRPLTNHSRPNQRLPDATPGDPPFGCGKQFSPNSLASNILRDHQAPDFAVGLRRQMVSDRNVDPAGYAADFEASHQHGVVRQRTKGSDTLLQDGGGNGIA